VFLRPAGFGGRIIGKGTGVAFGILRRVTGVDLLNDLSVFFRALGGMIDGFVARADRVGALLADPGTTFLIVTSPRHDPVEESIFFHRKLHEAGMPFGGLVVNRVHLAPELNGELPDELVEELGEALAGRVATSARELAALAARDERNIADLRERLSDPPLLIVPERQDDIHDVEGLAHVREHLWGVSPARRS
jgi:anion-transporting  ArsA/GET3 family ATPase